MGIDPGSHLTGVGLIQASSTQLSYIHHQLIRAPKQAPLEERISVIFQNLQMVFKQHLPDLVIIERVFFGKNADSAFKLGHARGVAMLAAHQSGAQILEVSAKEVKKIITGSGAAAKEQVRDGVCRWLRIALQEREMDVSDALSLAIAGSFEYEKSLRIQKMERELGRGL